MKRIKGELKKLKSKSKQIFAQVKRILGYVLNPCIHWIKVGEFRARVRYAGYYKRLAIREKTVLYESFMGRGMVCNPYALFCCMRQDARYAEYTHIWVLDDFSNHQVAMKEYESCSNVKFVEYQSREHLKALASAEILVNNVSFWGYFVKKPGQIYINTWHGIPLKYLGFDMPDGAMATKNMMRSLLQTDYLLSANSFLTQIYQNSYYIKEIYNGKILEEGYPRNDTLFSDREYVLNKLADNGVKIDSSKKIILYAPTWRGTNFSKPNDDVDDILAFRAELSEKIDLTQYQILVKPHNALGVLFRSRGASDFVVPSSFDANEVLAVTDILVSDYSSIYFDFLTTRRPVLFYITDQEEYMDERGLYFGLDQLPAPFTDDISQLAGWVNQIEEFQRTYAPQYEKVRDFCENADKKNISTNILDIILKQNSPTVEVASQSGKTRLLILKGAPLLNGIGTSAYNLLNQIDYEKYDVTLYMYSPTNQEQKNYINGVNPKCRVMLRTGTFTTTFCEEILVNVCNIYTHSLPWLNKIFPDSAYSREVLRCFGASSFDYVIDFDGYSRLMDLIALQIPAKKRYIWQHNDMKNEFDMKYKWLKHTFSLYPYFDGIVGCAEATMEVNREKLSTPETYDKFTYATNLFDAERVQTLLESSQYVQIDGMNYFHGISTSGETRLIPLEIDTKRTADNEEFIKEKTWVNGIIEAIPTRNEKLVKFITVGRCSPEKNHIALIDGFAKLVKERPNCMLYIVGHGANFMKEYQYVIKKKLQNHVVMTNNLKNPFGLIKQCDCFILPSIHEGQPIVLLEARMLGMPILMSNFSSAKSSLLENGQLIVGTSRDEIYQGMNRFLDGAVPCEYHFDIKKYNQKCYQEFLALISD